MDGDRDPRTYAIIGAAMKVHSALGPGHLESVYQNAMALELGATGIPFQREVPLPVHYNGMLVGTFRADFLCHAGIVLELKATSAIGRPEIAQVANYLAATGQPLGLLINFGLPSLDFRRVIGRHAVPKRHNDDQPG